MVTPLDQPPQEGPFSAADRLVHLLGIELVSYGDGEAVCALTVRDTHVNAIGRTHGGTVFALADAAISRASNRPGAPAVVTMSSIQIVRASRPGDRLVARATADHRGGRIAAYRADIRCGDALVATMTAQAVRIDGSGTR